MSVAAPAATGLPLRALSIDTDAPGAPVPRPVTPAAARTRRPPCRPPAETAGELEPARRWCRADPRMLPG